MSYVLSGIVVPDSVPGTQRVRDGLDIPMDIIALGGGSTILTNLNRLDVALPEERITGLLGQYGKLMTVLWDDQKGLRESHIYFGSGKRIDFGQEDELYVELDDDGYPVRAGNIYTAKEVEEQTDDKEFETYRNAVELGCEACGFCTPQLLMDLIRKQA